MSFFCWTTPFGKIMSENHLLDDLLCNVGAFFAKSSKQGIFTNVDPVLWYAVLVQKSLLLGLFDLGIIYVMVCFDGSLGVYWRDEVRGGESSMIANCDRSFEFAHSDYRCDEKTYQATGQTVVSADPARIGLRCRRDLETHSMRLLMQICGRDPPWRKHWNSVIRA